MANGIASALNTLVVDEGRATATQTAERWLAALEEMAEVSTSEQQEHISVLLNALNMYFDINKEAR